VAFDHAVEAALNMDGHDTIGLDPPLLGYVAPDYNLGMLTDTQGPGEVSAYVNHATSANNERLDRIPLNGYPFAHLRRLGRPFVSPPVQ
jgi:hypothetical protein